MANPLENEITWVRVEIARVRQTIAKVEGGHGTMKRDVLHGLHTRLALHEQKLSELEIKRERGF